LSSTHINEQEDVWPDSFLLNRLSLAGTARVAVKQPAALLNVTATQPAAAAAVAAAA
jgi:hypothetical protein